MFPRFTSKVSETFHQHVGCALVRQHSTDKSSPLINKYHPDDRRPLLGPKQRSAWSGIGEEYNCVKLKEKVIGKTLGYQNQELRTRPLPMAAGPLPKKYCSELDPICKLGDQSFWLILQLGCLGSPGINVLLPLVCWVLLGFYFIF